MKHSRKRKLKIILPVIVCLVMASIGPAMLGAVTSGAVFSQNGCSYNTALSEYDNTPPSFDRIPDYKQNGSEQHYLSMTFDDSPRGNTAEILDILKKYNMRATFFVLGIYAKNSPDLLKRIVAEGHTIANHTYDHKAVTALNLQQLEWEIRTTEELVFDITGRRTILFRPPYGVIYKNQLNFVSGLGYSTVFWSVDSDDYLSIEKSVNNAKTAKPGDIVLFHTNFSTGETIEEICKYYQEQNLMSVPVEELLALEHSQEDGVKSLHDAGVVVY